MTTDQHAILKRIRRKAEIMRMDLKEKNDQAYHDAGEIITLLDLMEKM